jgi:hypothetical protein
MSEPKIDPKPGSQRALEVGDLVLVGFKRLPREGGGLGVFPAIVLDVDNPGEATCPLTLSVLRPQGTITTRGTRHSADVAEDRWSWPGPRADGHPR